MNKEMDLYTDYLLSSFSQVTATGLSALLDGSVSHDKITRMLSNDAYDSKALWHEVKSLVRAHGSDDACLIFDDTVISKPCIDENDMICWHWDHSRNRNEKGINLLTAFYHTHSSPSAEPLRIPIAFECVKKTVRFTDAKTGREKRKSPVTKNEMMRSMLKNAVGNQYLKFRYVLADSWFASSDNMLFIDKLKKYFVMDIKNSRLCMLATQDRNEGRWTDLDKLSLRPKQPVKVWIKDLEIPVLLCGFVFIKQRRLYGRDVSGKQRFEFVSRTIPKHLQETVERGGISQVSETECLIGKVANRNGNCTDHAFICLIAGLCQIGAIKIGTQNEPFCPESKTVLGGIKNGMVAT